MKRSQAGMQNLKIEMQHRGPKGNDFKFITSICPHDSWKWQMLSSYILKERIVGFKIPQKIELSANFPHFFLLRTRKISHTDLIGLAWISHTAHRTQRVHIGKNISVIFSMINMEV